MLTLPALSYSPRTGANLVVKLALRLSGSPFPGPQDSKAVFLLEFICYQTQVPPLGHPWVKSGRYKRKNKRKLITSYPEMICLNSRVKVSPILWKRDAISPFVDSESRSFAVFTFGLSTAASSASCQALVVVVLWGTGCHNWC